MRSLFHHVATSQSLLSTRGFGSAVVRIQTTEENIFRDIDIITLSK
jgi:hypothetical protein